MLLTVGGTVPAEDVAELERHGVAAVFTPGTSMEEIVAFMHERVSRARSAA